MVGALGAAVGVPRRFAFADRARQHANLLVAVVTMISAAQLLSLAFFAEQLSQVDDNTLRRLLDGEMPTAAWLPLSLQVATAGLACAMVGLVWCNHEGFSRWGYGCLCVTAAAVLGLFPMSVVVLIDTATQARLSSG